MKRSKLLFTCLAIFTLFSACESETKQTQETEDGTEKTYIINTDTAFSRVMYSGSMVGIYTHTGKLAFLSGQLTAKNGTLTGGKFTVDMTNMYPTDENYDPEEGKTREKLVGHLKSADFFDVQNYPTASFTITSVSGSEAKGILNIRGKENEETVKNINVSKDGNMIKATGELTFDRKKYDVMFDMSVQEMVISNDVKLDVVITAIKMNQ